MYKVNVSAHFSAAHQLRGYDGECRNVHGHTWKVRIGILCDSTDEIGMALDFNIVKKILNGLVDEFDHKFLNELAIFQAMNPTSENIARYMYKQVQEKLTMQRCKVADVEIWESDRSSITYTED